MYLLFLVFDTSGAKINFELNYRVIKLYSTPHCHDYKPRKYSLFPTFFDVIKKTTRNIKKYRVPIITNTTRPKQSIFFTFSNKLNFYFQHVTLVKNLSNHNHFSKLKSVIYNTHSFVWRLGLNRLKYTPSPNSLNNQIRR